MGCTGGAREKLEDKIMLMKLERMEIRMEKAKNLEKLSEIEGHKINRHKIPDYIDPKFAKEKKIYEDDDEIGDKKTDDIERKERKGKKKKDKDKSKSRHDKHSKHDKHDKKYKNDKKDHKHKKDSKDKKRKK